MIGNLMLAVSTALFSGLLAVGQVNAAQPHNATEYASSHVFEGVQTTVYESYNIRTSLFDQAVEYDYAIFGYDFTNDSFTMASMSGNGGFLLYDYFEDFGSDYSMTGDSFFNFNDFDDSKLYLLWQRYNYFDDDNNEYNTCIRVLVPKDFSHDGIELCITTDWSDAIYGTFGPSIDANTTDFIVTSNIGNFYTWYSINNVSYNASASNTLVSSSIRNEYFITDQFLQFYIGYNQDPYVNKYAINFQLDVVDYVNLYGSYSNGYNDGWNDGYTLGYKDGYSIGLSTAQQGTFHGLFNSIADTPLRFLYGLFNFDLFGTSMLVIILSLLTGIVVFGLVKKFWK